MIAHPSSAIRSYRNVSFMRPESIKPVWKQHLSQFESRVYIFLLLFAESRWCLLSLSSFLGAAFIQSRAWESTSSGVSPMPTPSHLLWKVPVSTQPGLCKHGLFHTQAPLSGLPMKVEKRCGDTDLFEGPHNLQGAEQVGGHKEQKWPIPPLLR